MMMSSYKQQLIQLGAGGQEARLCFNDNIWSQSEERDREGEKDRERESARDRLAMAHTGLQNLWENLAVT